MRSDLGRFISKDPLGMIDGTNMFIYVQNNPVMWTDPHGLVVVETHGCPPNKIADIVAAVEAACNAASVLPPKRRDKVERKCDGVIEIFCENSGDSCAWTKPWGNNIHLNPAGLTPRCGCLESTIFHEIIHTTGAGETTATGCEALAFNCGGPNGGPPSGDPCDCK